MLVTVFCAPRDRPETTFALEVSPELELRDFVALCELESGIPAGEIQITYVEQPLKDPTRALGTYGVKDGDVVVLRQAERRPPQTQPAFPGLPRIDFRSIAVPGTSSSTNQRAPRPQQPAPPPQPQPQPPPPPQRAAQPSAPLAFRGPVPQGLDNPALLQQMLLTNPHELSLLKERNPPLAEALLSGDLERFTKVLLEQQQDRAKRDQERIRLLTADPFDLEAQAKIEEEIRQHNVEENMTIAMEEAPESFGQVVMLYINCKVNGHPVKAFVDSGAQMTIMSQACAERCNIMRLVDRRWAGIAKGVGTQKIIGRVHLAQVQIEGDFLPCSFSILEDQPMDMLLGLDMLKRHQCSIDLKKSVLVISTTGTETRFLSESELPECARLAYGAEGREDARPEEVADRELAEALQRSIQESALMHLETAEEGRYQPDTADGRTTSPQPSPFTSSRPLDQTPSSISPSQNPALDCSPSAPATMEQAHAPEHGPQEPPQLSSPAAESSSLVHPLRSAPAPDVPLGPSPSSEMFRTFVPPADEPSASQDLQGEMQPRAVEGDVQSNKVESSSMSVTPEELSPRQPMEQEVAKSGYQASPTQSESVDMETVSDGAASAESDQPDGERRPSSDCIPSLAAALKELHELLVSNNQSQSHSTSCSPPNAAGQDSDKASSEPGMPIPESTAIAAGAETRDAKANYTAADALVSDEEPNLPSQEEVHLSGGISETEEDQGPLPCPGGLEEGAADDQEETSNIRISEPEFPTGPPLVPDLREPPEGQPGRGDADGRASGTNIQGSLQTEHTFLTPLSVEVGPPEEVSCTSSSSAPLLTQAPQLSSPAPLLQSLYPFTEQFPAEHIQRIQAAGFSAREAVEALERAHGVVEIALLALLARSITVPT